MDYGTDDVNKLEQAPIRHGHGDGLLEAGNLWKSDFHRLGLTRLSRKLINLKELLGQTRKSY